MDDPYTDPRIGVLKNLLGIESMEELASVEADITAAALYKLGTSPAAGEGHFDLAHLRALHVRIFGDLYPWAGRLRTVEIAKGARFCPALNIQSFGDSVFHDLAENHFLVGRDRPALVEAIAALYGQLNALHPFREGNGRTQRAFLSQLGRVGGWRLTWDRLDGAANDLASAQSLAAGDDTLLMSLVDDLLELDEPAGGAPVPRRAVLVIPEVAEYVGDQVEAIRRGPFPAEAGCHVCDERYPLRDETTVLSLQHAPAIQQSRVVFAHARCARSRVLPALPARLARAVQQRLEAEGADATGIAMMGHDGRPGFLWGPNVSMLGLPHGETVDLWLNEVSALGLEPSSNGVPPTEPTPGWHVTVTNGGTHIRVLDPEGVDSFVGNLDAPADWVEAVAGSGRCALLAVTRCDWDAESIGVAAEQGRLVVGLAEAVVD
jgi:cell filamentation protein